jgi:hypothetical protein
MVLSSNEEAATFTWLDGIYVAATVCDRQWN